MNDKTHLLENTDSISDLTVNSSIQTYQDAQHSSGSLLVKTDDTSYLTFVQKRWAKFSEKHRCALIESLKETSIINETIDSGVLINCRRRLQKMTMISEKHPLTKRVFKSQARIREEEVRHLIRYKSMIHPFSLFCLYYEFFMAFVHTLYFLTVFPEDMAFVRYYPSVKYNKLCIDLIVTLAVILNFFIGYFDSDRVYVEMNFKRVAWKNLKTYFIWDVISCIPSYMVYWYLHAVGPSYISLTKWISSFRLARVIFLLKISFLIRLYINLSPLVYAMLQIALVVYVAALCCTIFVFFFKQWPYLHAFITELEDTTMAKGSLYTTISGLLGVGKLEYTGAYVESGAFVCVSLVSLILLVYLMTKINILYQRFVASSDIDEDLNQQLNCYLKYKGIPPKLREEVYGFFRFRFQKKFFDEKEVLKLLSHNLRKELPNYKFDKRVEKLHFVRFLPRSLIISVIANLELLYYCPGDVIFNVNTMGKALFYIKYGCTGLFDENGIEVCHLEDGSYYGDISVVLKLIRPVSMIALTQCEVYRLKRSALLNILNTYPGIKEQVFQSTRVLFATRQKDWVIQEESETIAPLDV